VGEVSEAARAEITIDGAASDGAYSDLLFFRAVGIFPLSRLLLINNYNNSVGLSLSCKQANRRALALKLRLGPEKDLHLYIELQLAQMNVGGLTRMVNNLPGCRRICF